MSYYEEYLDDLIDHGASEVQALEQIGSIPEIVATIASENKEVKVKRANPFSWMLILLGLPLWGPLLLGHLIVFASVIFSALACSLAFGFSGIWFLVISSSIWWHFGGATSCGNLVQSLFFWDWRLSSGNYFW
ncbi:hypothetical protein HU830_05285 [Lactobacillus sp. DCY120]|uniref:Uncharacterized protein n=1 Tax=Bombilactobacillus apium TaxID=2675299 RepID=A0A850RCT7_9LACO|nr:hypothetical protein [Bombilactobacillus apium]NVY96578.1 hypothetical protein [Bombilactobacillus apium]